MEGAPKRFRIQEDRGVPEKVHGLQDVVEALRQEHPEILGATLFGSLSKGRAHERSDIDTWVFIDADQAAERYSKDSALDSRTNVNTPIFSTRPPKAATLFSEDIHDSYEDLVRNALAEKTGMRRFMLAGITEGDYQKDMMKDVGVMPISMSGIDAIVKDATTFVLLRPPQRITAWGRYANGKDFNRFPAWMHIIVPMFHLAVGNGIRPYRSRFLRGLLAKGAAGRRVWKEVVEQLKLRESDTRKGPQEGVHYPETLEEAVAVYARDVPQKEES